MTSDATKRRPAWAQRRRVNIAVVATVVAGLLALAVYALAASPEDSFRVSGITPARLLSPGAGGPIDLRFTNPQSSVLRLRRIEVTVRDIRAPQADATHPCTAADFAIVQYSGAYGLDLPPASTSTLSSLGIPAAQWPRVVMHDRPVNQDGCKNASLLLRFAGIVGHT